MHEARHYGPHAPKTARFLVKALVPDCAKEIVPDDKKVFQDSMIISILVGGVSSLVFHFVVKATDKTQRKVIFGVTLKILSYNSKNTVCH